MSLLTEHRTSVFCNSLMQKTGDTSLYPDTGQRRKDANAHTLFLVLQSLDPEYDVKTLSQYTPSPMYNLIQTLFLWGFFCAHNIILSVKKFFKKSRKENHLI